MTSANIERVRQLADWLAATDIGRLELRGPGESICLQRENGRIAVVDDAPDEPAGEPAKVPAIAAMAPSVGVFLHRHPLRDAVLAEPGASVHRGQVLGRLQIGALLRPVTSPCDGVVAAVLVEDGTTAGFGTPLIEIHPWTST